MTPKEIAEGRRVYKAATVVIPTLPCSCLLSKSGRTQITCENCNTTLLAIQQREKARLVLATHAPIVFPAALNAAEALNAAQADVKRLEKHVALLEDSLHDSMAVELLREAAAGEGD